MSRDEWAAFVGPPDADPAGSGIYLWTIGNDTYVGKATHILSRRREYLNNVRKIELGRPYRKGKPDGFRAVHLAPADAKKAGRPVRWELLETCGSGSELLERERHWIAELSPTLNGPRRTKP